MIVIGICLFLFCIWVIYVCAKDYTKDRIKNRVKYIKNRYPRAYKQYISKRGNYVYERNPSIDSLKKVASRSNTIWEQEEEVLEEQEIRQNELNRKSRELESAYPNGFRHWKYLNPRKTTEEIIESANEIQQFEKFYQTSKRYDSWEKEQKEFVEKNDEIAEEYLTKFGGYIYKIPFEKINVDGKKVAGTYKVWHYFLQELCLDEDLNYTLFPDENKYLAKLPEFKTKTRYFKEGVYKQIIDFINELQREEKVLVYINGNVPDWSVDSLYYHYKNIFPAFDEKNMYAPVLYETLGLQNVDWISNLKRRIVIIDMMTDTSRLKEICENIIKKAKRKQPLITYISLFKCYSREEAQELIDNRTKEKEEEERKRKEAEEQKRKQEEALRKKRMMLGAAESNRWPMVKGVHHYFFYYYYPTRFDNITEFDWNVRYLIWDFKDGKKHDEVCKMLTTKLKRVYGEALDLLTFVCIPASTCEVNHKRYCSFMADVCNATGMENGYDHITIKTEKDPAHKGGTSVAEYAYNKEFFNGRQIILFDDVVTRGRSLAKMKMELEGVGAHIVAALSIGHTYSDFFGDIREQHPWLEENEDYEIETI